MSSTQRQNEKRVREYIENAWLNLGKDFPSYQTLENPFFHRTRQEIENPLIEMFKIFNDPKNFYFTVKHLFNIELLPFQIVILQELWTRKYPMLVASRGAGKSFMLGLYSMLRAFLHQGSKVVVVGAGFRQSKVIFDYCEKIWTGAPVLRSICEQAPKFGPSHGTDQYTMTLGESTIIALPIGDGCLTKDCLITTNECVTNIDFENSIGIVKHNKSVWSSSDNKFVFSDESYFNGIQKTKKVTTKRGFSIEGTFNHKLKILRNNKVDWVRLDEMIIGDRILIDRSERWHSNHNEVNESQAYALGLMIGDGCWTDKYKMGFATKDEELINSLRIGTGLEFKQGSDEVHYTQLGMENRQNWLDFWGLEHSYALIKKLPKKLLASSKLCIASCLSALYDTDGHVQVNRERGGTAITVGFTNTSEQLVNQIQYLLLHFGIISTKSSRTRDNKNWNRIYELFICGNNTKKFAEKINFKLTRKRLDLEKGLLEKFNFRSNDDEIPDIKNLMLEAIKGIRVKKGEGTNLTNSVSLTKIKGRKTITSSYLKVFLDVNKDNKHPNIQILKSLLNEDIYYDTIISIIDSEAETYDIHIPETHEYCANGFFSHNTKIRGQRANYIIADEFASMNQEIYENVISGFAAVSANPVKQVKLRAEQQAMRELGIDNETDMSFSNGIGNQAIVSGTAYYDFNLFAKYWKRYKDFIKSRNDPIKLKEYYPEGIPASFDYRDYSVIRIPVDSLPPGFMDEKHVARSKATIHSGLFSMEFGAVFTTDSNGFFKRSLIESCVTSNPIFIDGQNVQFHADLRGNRLGRYVYGIDPASEVDNFSIVILELHETHRRIVYSWVTNKEKHREAVKKGVIKEQDYYGFCARKIRDLMRVFPCERIALDSQGGGFSVEESLHDPDKMQPGEYPIWKVIEEGKEQSTDGFPGLHIIELINFAKADWVSGANHGLRKDLEDKAILFPFFDTLSLGFAVSSDKAAGRSSDTDTLEDCVNEIEELKDELATIVHTQTGIAGRDRWDTPEVKLPGGKKGRMRKDRYSALLMANMVARTLQRAPEPIAYNAVGGFVGNTGKYTGGALYTGPDWFTKGSSGGCYGGVVRRGV